MKRKINRICKNRHYKDKIYKNIVRNVFCHSSIMFRKSIIKKIGNYHQKLSIPGLRILLKTMKLNTPSIILNT